MEDDWYAQQGSMLREARLIRGTTIKTSSLFRAYPARIHRRRDAIRALSAHSQPRISNDRR
jgi:hypothetical protein